MNTLLVVIKKDNRGIGVKCSRIALWRDVAYQRAANLFILVSLSFFSCIAYAALDDGVTLADAWSFYERGDYSTAVQHWLPLAQRGNASAQVSLGTAYDYGQGVSRDAVQAIRWYRAAAEQGHSGGQYNLALMYALGEGIQRDMIAASSWYKKSAEQGLAVAEFNLGMLYIEGDGVQKNTAEGIKWLRKAAQQNHTSAQYNLGMIYALGKEISSDQEAAARWLSKAATAYLAKDDKQNAHQAYQALLRYTPNHSSLSELADHFSGMATMENAKLSSDAEPMSVGTGWPVAGGYVVTNHHVVADSQQVTLVNVHGDEIQASVVVTDDENDIALLKVTDGQDLPRALPLAKTGARLGSSVFTVGFPRIDVMGKRPKLSNGIISGESGYQDNPRTFQISVPIQSGNSGGPLLNMKGEVVGVVTSMLGISGNGSEAMPIGNINYALKAAYLENLLDSLPSNFSITHQAPKQTSDLESLAGVVQESVLIVMAK